MPNFDKPDRPRPAIPVDPLPQAGESLQEKLIETLFGRAMPWLLVLLFVAVIALSEWLHFLTGIHPTLGSSTAATLVLALIASLAWFKVRRAFKDVHNLKLGIRGETHVGKYLDDQCRPLGYRVLHDIPCTSDTGGTDFNIDHVLIGPAGIFAIETKNWSKPPQGTPAKLWYVETPDGGTLKKSDGTLDAAPVIQARANVAKVRKILAEQTGRDRKSIPAHAVLLFPGWYVQGKANDLWALPDNALHQWLPWEPDRLSPQEIELFYNKLTVHVREKRHAQ